MPTTAHLSCPTFVSVADIVTGVPTVAVPKLSAAGSKLSEHLELVVWQVPSTQ